MKRIVLLSIITNWLFINITTAQNPFKEFGVDVGIITLSKGKYPEFIPNDTIHRIGTVVIDTRTGKIIELINTDSVEVTYNYKTYVASRWISPDPLTEEYPDWTPYRYAFNNPIKFIDPNGLLEDWYQADDGQLLWKEGKEESVTLVSNVDNAGNVLETKTYNWVAADGTKLGDGGANVVITAASATTWERDAVNIANASESNTVIALAGSDGALSALENVTSSFGNVNNVAMRDHGNGEGVFGILKIDNFSALENKISSGAISLNKNSEFFFLGCNNDAFAKSFTSNFGIPSYGATSGVGPANNSGSFIAGERSDASIFNKYSISYNFYPVSYRTKQGTTAQGWEVQKTILQRSLGKILNAAN